MPRRHRSQGTRAPNGASSIYYSEYDGRWHGRVTVGVRDDGRPDRRHVKRKTEAEVVRAIRKFEQDRSARQVRKPGKPWTVEGWLRHWVEEIAEPTVRYKALLGYRTAVYRHLIPNLGAHKIDKVQPEHFEKLYRKMQQNGLKAATAHQVHRTARTAFGEAQRRGHLTRNPVALAKPPRIEEEEVQPFTVEEARRILAAATRRRNGVRFAMALALGLRKGEALGLKWSRVDLENGLLRTPTQLQRQSWQHGCVDPEACARAHHKSEACPPHCQRHKRCPAPCPPDCTGHAAHCPERTGGGLREVEVKSRAGKRAVGIPAPLVHALRQHKAAQDRERQLAAELWEEGDWVFTQATGRPIDPRGDHDGWKSLLREAGVRDARLHDARHTAATMLLALGVPNRSVMEIMGWSELSMTMRYQHVSHELLGTIASQVEALLWGGDTRSDT